MRASLTAFAGAFVLAALAWAGLFFLDAGRPTWGSQWTHDLYETKSRALAAIPGPRLVVAGGSGATFSVRADVLREELGVAAFNFGTHAGLDLDYILHRLRGVLRKGDTVLLVLEFELFDRDGTYAGPFLLDYTLARDPRYLRSRGWRSVLHDMGSLSYQRALQPWWQPFSSLPPRPAFDVYTSAHVDAVGDSHGNLPVLKPVGAGPAIDAYAVGYFGVLERNLQSVGMFNAWCEENGVRVLATAPALVASRLPHAEPIDRALATLSRWNAEHRMPYLMEPRDAVYPSSEFFDSPYHLDRSAAARHTRRLAQRLRPFVESLRAGATLTVEDMPEADLQRLERRFSGWQPDGGFVLQGPLPGADVAIFHALTGDARIRSRLESGPAVLHGVVSSPIPGQAVDILAGSTRVARCAIPQAGQPYTFDVALGSLALNDALGLKGTIGALAFTTLQLVAGSPIRDAEIPSAHCSAN